MISASRSPAAITIVLPIHLCSSFHALLGLGNLTKSPVCTMLQKEITFSIRKVLIYESQSFHGPSCYGPQFLPSPRFRCDIHAFCDVTHSVVEVSQSVQPRASLSGLSGYDSQLAVFHNLAPLFQPYWKYLQFLSYNLRKCFLLEAFSDCPSLNSPLSHILEKHSTLLSSRDLRHLFT